MALRNDIFCILNWGLEVGGKTSRRLFPARGSADKQREKKKTPRKQIKVNNDSEEENSHFRTSEIIFFFTLSSLHPVPLSIWFNKFFISKMMFDEDNNNSNRVKKRSNHNRNSSRLAFETLREWYFGDRAISDADFLPGMAGLDFDINESQEAVESFNSFWNGTAGGDGGRVVTVQSRSNNPPLARLNPQIHPTRSRHIFYFLPHPLSLSLSWCGVYIYGKLWSNST